MMYSRRYLQLLLLSLHYLPGLFELREGWLTADLYEVVGRSFVPLNPRLVISLSLFAVPGWCQTVRDRFVLSSTFT